VSDRFVRHKQPWKGEELDLLRTLARKGKGLKEIAKALGRSEESTRDRARADKIAIAKKR
jgi:DNA-binding NarL/FixJ family response regulator